MKMKNMGDVPYHMEIGGMPGVAPLVIDCAPGEVCEVPDVYCRRNFLEGHAPKLVPYVESVKAPEVKPMEAPKAKK